MSKNTKNESKQEAGEKKYSIYARVPEEIRDKIDALKSRGKSLSYIITSAIEIYDIYNSIPNDLSNFVFDHEKEYGGQKNVIIEALKLLRAKTFRDKASEEELLIRARKDLNMMLVQKNFFSNILDELNISEKILEKFIEKFITLDVVLWYAQKPIKNLNLEEFLLSMKKLLLSFNYFYLIDVKKERENKFFITFSHHQNKKYGLFFLNYFKITLNSDNFPFTCSVIGDAYEKTLSITIKQI